jgi:arylsulfatase A-like enzyme
MPRRALRHAGRPALGALLSLVLAGCGGGAPPPPPNVVLLVLDTVRADHIGCYGYERAATPFLDELAGGADRYTRAESTAPWTLPSHASMFTGVFPFQHGADSGRSPQGRVFDARPLDPGRRTLAEALSSSGYRSAAFVANAAYLADVFGLNQGFETYHVERGPAEQVNGHFFRWLAGHTEPTRGEPQPFFAFLNYMDAHRPYNTAALPDPRSTLLPAPDPAPSGDLLDELYAQVMARSEAADPALVARIVGQYDNGIAWLDLAVEGVAKQLRARGLWENTLLIVTSDHGEYFGEHGLVEHSKDLYQEAIRVPLIVKRPGQTRGRVIDERTTLAALPGLVVANLPPHLRRSHATDFPLHDERSPVLAEIHFTRAKDLAQPWGARFDRERTALYAANFKLILSTDGQNELFDLSADPGEQFDLHAQKPKLAEALAQRLRSLLEAGATSGSDATLPELGEAQLEELRRLGYL